MTVEIEVVRSETYAQKPNTSELGFGNYFTDHMFIMDYTEEKGWYQPKIVPFQNISLHPAAKVLHYGQSVFEGTKAYRTKDGRVLLFRPDRNIRRLNLSNERLSIPQMDPEVVLEAILQLVRIDRDWVPSDAGTSLYIRPFVFSTEPHLGVHPSKEYRFVIILSPVGSYYAEGIRPVKIYVENEFVRAVRGGTGAAKTAGNYASGLLAQEQASEKGYTQVLWLDALQHKYIEEVGSMNVFFKIAGQVITPALSGSILDGITRNSVIHLLQEQGIPVVERALSIEEVFDAYQAGTLEEAFGTGTAAVISPIGELQWQDKEISLHYPDDNRVWKHLYDKLTGIQSGRVPDTFEWTVEV
jgi:branched-chain amino acid aminotransferase